MKSKFDTIGEASRMIKDFMDKGREENQKISIKILNARKHRMMLADSILDDNTVTISNHSYISETNIER